jgi:N-acetylglucosaminyl-diphospho-decaprenol L-rhamnosyltransferase
MTNETPQLSSPARPKWTLVTVTYNNAETLRIHWENYRKDFCEWIVVDNASSDDSVEVARRLGARVIETGFNGGFAVANNLGIHAANGQYIACVNPDVIVDFQSLDLISSLLDTEPGLISPQLTNPDGSLQPNGRGMPTPISKVRNRIYPNLNTTYRIFSREGEQVTVGWLTGAVVCASSATWAELGGWDERFFLYWEDTELCFRAWDKGISVRVDGSTKWVHSWARETINFKWKPWKRELTSALKFYQLHARLIFPKMFWKRRYPWESQIGLAWVTQNGQVSPSSDGSAK